MRETALFVFTLLFTSLTVLWICQVAPKRLALENSEHFLRKSKFLWSWIKGMSWVDLPGPAAEVERVIKRVAPGYGQARHLRPGRVAHYNTTAQIYGFSLDRLSVDISIGRRGSGWVVKKFLLLFLHGGRDESYGSVRTDRAVLAGTPRVRILGLWTAPVPERLELIANDLDAMFEDRELVGDRFKRIETHRWPHAVYPAPPQPFGQGYVATWTIRGAALPERFWNDPEDGPLVALLYEAEAQVGEGEFEQSGRDEFPENIEVPCRRFSVSVRATAEAEHEVDLAGCEVTLLHPSVHVPSETDRWTKRALGPGSKTNTLDIRYPLHGGIYTVWWKAFPRHAA